MSHLAHATCAVLGVYALKAKAERDAIDHHIQTEIADAKRIQKETGCSWSEALRLAYASPRMAKL